MQPTRRRHRHRSTAALNSLLLLSPLLTIATLSVLSSLPTTHAHGYLKTPRARNLLAYQEKDYEYGSEDSPYPEDCPHCLNRGGTLTQCGLLTGIDPLTGEPWTRDYSFPKNAVGSPMPPSVQEVYTEGEEIEVEIMVTTHHKGHFVMSACTIVPLLDDGDSINDVKLPLDAPTPQCFNQNHLTFVSDKKYNAQPDPNYPERAYIAPASIVEWTNGDPARGAEYSMVFKLPMGVVGEVVLIQWYYLTANSCVHEGYEDYQFPSSWGPDTSLYKGLPECGEVPKDGDGVPEQFWNCAEVKIERKKKGGNNDSPPAALAASQPKPAPPVTLPPPKLCTDATSNYYQATRDCTGYIYCQSGTPSQEYPCGSGMLYDESSQNCEWADDVVCGGLDTISEGGKNPTNRPTNKPNALLDWNSASGNVGHEKTMIGYYASWQWYDRDGLAAPINYPWSKITRANFAFFQITTAGDIYGTDNWADPITLFGPYNWAAAPGEGDMYCSWDSPDEAPACSAHNYEEGLIYLAHAAGVEVYPSIGGWSLSDPFPAMAANPEARKRFASQCVDLIKNYNFDGIDLDWEYPGYVDHSGTPDDTVNFNLLLDDVRSALDELEAETGRYYGITAALPCGPDIIANQDIAHVSSVLTELNLMTYDFHGSWNPTTGVNAPLYDQEGSAEFSVHGCVENWLAGGAKKDKINIGFPFYGRSFAGAKGLYEPHNGPDETTFFLDEGTPQFYNIVKELPTMTTVRDERTMTQYAYSEKGMVSYDDERAICDKTEYAMDNNLNGYIIWELSGDLMEDLSTPLLDAANAKLRDPSLNCAGASLSDEISSALESKLEDKPIKLPPFYPVVDTAKCINDGKQPSWLQSTQLFDNEQACCDYHFAWNQDCSSGIAPPAPETATTTSSTTTQIQATLPEQTSTVATVAIATSTTSTTEKLTTVTTTRPTKPDVVVIATDEEDTPSMSEIFAMATPEIMMLSPVVDNGKEEKPSSMAGYYAAGANLVQESAFARPMPQTNQVEYKVPLDAFYAALLSVDSPYILEYYRPNKMEGAVSTYLVSFIDANVDDWSPPTHFELECSRSKEQFGSEIRRVLNCEGNAVFAYTPQPRKRSVNDAVHQAFAGAYHEEFLQFMYPDYVSNELKLNSDKKDKKQQKLEMNLAQLSRPRPNKQQDAVSNKQQKKEQIKLERQQQRQDGGHRMLRTSSRQ
jgi:chitinase